MLGRKAEGLLALRDTYGDLVPEFVVLPLTGIIVGGADALVASSTLASSTTRLEISDDAVARLLGEASAWPVVAVRTSALGEDGERQSFAGLFETVLDVTPDQQADAIAKCLASLTGERVRAYATAHGVEPPAPGGSIVVQRMVHGRIAGVMFTETGAGELEVAYSTAGPDAVVTGQAARTFRLDATDPLPRRALLSRGGALTRRTPVPRRLLEIGRELHAAHGPMDVEFAAGGRRVWLLQARPVTVTDRTSSAAWDSTNIGENYPDVTLPLTYSFIRGVYGEVYPSFFRLLGRSDAQLRAHDHVFRNALGYVRGHVHYRIDNWFEMAAMLPGGTANQEFFAAMLQPVKEGEVKPKARPTILGTVALAWGGLRLVWLLATAEGRSRRFARRFRERYARYSAIRFEALAADAALTALGRIRTDLLAMWAVPILNDVRLMIWHGLLRRSFGTERNSDYLAFLTGLTDRASLAPLTALSELGQALRETGLAPGGVQEATRADSAMGANGTTGEPGASLETEAPAANGTTPAPAPEPASLNLSAHQRALVDAYLDVHGGRAPDELQLENPRLGDDTGRLVALALTAADAPIRPAPDQRVRGTLTQRIIGHQVRRAIDHRERFRYYRAQVFGFARDAYLSVGDRLATAGAIAETADVFWLTVEELDAAVFGHAWDTDLAPVVERRRARHAEYAPPLPSRRAVGSGVLAPLDHTFPHAPAPGEVAGQGVAPGVYTGEVLVLPHFDADAPVRGKVLVTSHVDPGWTLLFVAAGAIITERGNPLSHVAIIGRELGIPVIVAATGAMDMLKSGKTVTINGTTGEVTHVE